MVSVEEAAAQAIAATRAEHARVVARAEAATAAAVETAANIKGTLAQSEAQARAEREVAAAALEEAKQIAEKAAQSKKLALEEEARWRAELEAACSERDRLAATQAQIEAKRAAAETQRNIAQREKREALEKMGAVVQHALGRAEAAERRLAVQVHAEKRVVREQANEMARSRLAELSSSSMSFWSPTIRGQTDAERGCIPVPKLTQGPWAPGKPMPEPQEPREPQEPEEAQELQKLQEPHELQGLQGLQEPQELQQLQDATGEERPSRVARRPQSVDTHSWAHEAGKVGRYSYAHGGLPCDRHGTTRAGRYK